MKIRAIRVHKTGAPSVMKWDRIELAGPGPDQVLIRHTAIGFNLIETYIRKGLFPVPTLPVGLGAEGVGVIEAVGRRGKGFKPGQRVAYCSGDLSDAYSEARLRGTDGLIKLPAWLDDRTAAALLAKGETVQFLFNSTHKLKKGERILFHAAAGGIGLIACQWARDVGARMIGVVSSEAKARLAKRHGCKHVIVTSGQNITEEVMRITKGEGVDVVYDSIGKDFWEDSLQSVKPLGLVVSFGSASGMPPPVDLALKGREKSAFFTRASKNNYITSDEIRQSSARALFRMIKKGAIKPVIGQTYALKDAAKAHRDAEARRTTGSTLLIP